MQRPHPEAGGAAAGSGGGRPGARHGPGVAAAVRRCARLACARLHRLRDGSLWHSLHSELQAELARQSKEAGQREQQWAQERAGLQDRLEAAQRPEGSAAWHPIKVKHPLHYIMRLFSE